MRFQIVALASLLALAAAAPVQILKPRAATGVACPPFALQDYSTFQISDGVAGNAAAQANAAETAETSQFDPDIAAASGAAATALQNGKIKNKVLKLTIEILGLSIEAAQGKNEASSIAGEQTKLNNNIKLDTAAAGQASKGVV
ncbi:hypothetical protein FRB96_000777 [Tulasnella sp. 330]|nr:hypothetical protein FRB96_000777 [Tulasnella sp. 330]